MKKVAVVLVTVFGLAFLQPATASVDKSIVIIDTAIDSSIPVLKAKLVQEVCILDSRPCQNGTKFQEGLGSATLPSSQALTGGFEHGTIMSLIANKVNPDVNIIFIRIAGVLPNGKISTFSDIEIANALSWSIANKEKYNIVSVSASLGNHNVKTGANYCPITTRHDLLINNINTLSSMGVATMFAAGNNRDVNRVNFPACIPSAVTIAGSTEDNAISPFSNGGPTVDFYALESFNTQVKRSVGTSAATAAFSAYWAKNYKGTYQSTYDYMKSISQKAVGRNTKTDLLVDILK
jgi:hypothetical protein